MNKYPQELFDVRGKHVLVTGGSKGIGKAIASGFAAAGADVALLGRDIEALSRAANEMKAVRENIEVTTHVCDIRNTEEVRNTIASIDEMRSIDILINNAGMNIRTPAVDVTDEEWQTIIDTDLRGAFFVAQQVGKRMIGRGHGNIVNISSVGGHVALRTGVVYAAAKAGVIQMTKVLALEWAKHHVRVNCIGPWYFRTPLTEKLLNNPEYLSDIVTRTPMGRVGEVEELIGPALFLASDAASYVTGQTLFVDGGMTIYGF